MECGLALMEYFKMSTDWKWKRWDVRADGKIFWKYCKKRTSDAWVDWDWAIEEQRKRRIASKKRSIDKADSIKKYQKSYRENNKKKVAFHKWAHYLKNKNTYKSRSSAWMSANKERYHERMRKYTNNKLQTDQMFAIKRRMRSRVAYALNEKGYTKKSKTYEILGCEWHEFIAHIELMFCDGMSWDNRSEWHIDHIIPLSSAKNEDDMIKLLHYKNTRPLWAFDNLSKGAKIL